MNIYAEYVYMTIIKIETQEKIAGNNRKYTKTILYLKCDHCKIEYICPEYNKFRSLKQKHHFCTTICSSNSLKTGILREKVEGTLIDKYGIKGYVSAKDFQAKSKKTCIQKYGVDHGMKSDEGKKNFKEACLKKYGKSAFVGSDLWRSKIDFKENAQKAWVTKIRNGSCSKSYIEDRLYQVLCNEFGNEYVQRQVPMIRQWIDFYIKPLNLYLQLDGVYWHGLNRDVDIIRKSNKRQDKKIYKNYLRDQKLNKYMDDKGLKMIRITDKFFTEVSKEDLIKLLRSN